MEVTATAKSEIRKYIASINQRYQSDAQSEMSFRTDLQNLLDALKDNPAIVLTEEPSTEGGLLLDPKVGRPDFLLTRSGLPFAYIETKRIGDPDLKGKQSKGNKEQFDRYKASLDNLIFTDYVRFLLYQKGELVQEVSLADVTEKGIKALEKSFPAFLDLLATFFTFRTEAVTSSEQLATEMARKTRILRDIIASALEKDEKEKERLGSQYTLTSLYGLFLSFQKSLMEEAEIREFADVYAQTITYGLFVARYNDREAGAFSRERATNLIPPTNPFLRRLFNNIGGAEADSRILWVVEELVALYRMVDLHTLLHETEKQKASWQDDPIIHFYELFLGRYDKETKKDRGVWYTPQPVVQYIVKAVDTLLKERLDIPQGLAQGDTAGTNAVHILDPATGTGTFLAEVVRQVYQAFATQQGLWQSYVEKNLIPRLHAFEIMMASYTIAHFKLGNMLERSGFSFEKRKKQRLNIILTNSLERKEANSLRFDSLFGEEENLAHQTKHTTPVMVVLGNPPYNVESENKGEWITKAMDAYKKEPGGKIRLEERNPKAVNDDYVKFIRLGEAMIEKNRRGVLAYINPHGFMSNVTFRGMRWKLLDTFDEIYILDLHGNARKKETTRDGERDENVFDIMQGVSINLFIKSGKKKKGSLARVYHRDAYGLREEKFSWLSAHAFQQKDYTELHPSEPYYFFYPRDEKADMEFAEGFAINELMPMNNVGIVSSRDGFVIATRKETLQQRIEEFFASTISSSEIQVKYALKESKSWFIEQAQRNNSYDEKKLQVVDYRPFDNRWIYYDEKIVERPRYEVMQHLLLGDNVGLVSKRGFPTQETAPIHVTKNIIDYRSWSSAGMQGGDYLFPLYLYTGGAKDINGNKDSGGISGLFTDEEELEPIRKPNLDPTIVQAIAATMGLRFVAEERDRREGCFAPIDLLDYIYAVLYHPTYRERYFECLKIDFPRIPYPSSSSCFWQYVAIGSQLRQLHLMETPFTFSDFLTQYKVTGDNLVESVKWIDTTPSQDATAPEATPQGRVYINSTQYFEGVPRAVWEYFVGGHQPAQKWLKDRKGEKLSADELTHYQAIVVTLQRTIDLQAKLELLPLPNDATK